MFILLSRLLFLSMLVPAAFAQQSDPSVSEGDLKLTKPLPLEAQLTLNELVNTARKNGSAYKPFWIAIGHYRKTILGYRSSVQGDFFFRSQVGMRNPEAELYATIEDFLYPPEWMDDQNMHPQCHFPARLEWIKNELELADGVLPTPNCAQLNKWKKDLSPEAVSIVFASYYMGHPASIFGHTFLRIHNKNSTSAQLDHGVEFGVVLPEQMGFFQICNMVLSGIFGRYSGTFQVVRYYHFTNKYNKKESRDLWTFPIDLTESEQTLLINHLWELGAGIEFRYSFMRKNCAFLLLDLLDTVRTSDSLTSEFKYLSDSMGTVLTLESLRTLNDRGMLGEPSIDPSVATNADFLLRKLNKTEKDIAQRIRILPESYTLPEFARLENSRQAIVVDTAIELLKMSAVGSKRTQYSVQDRRRQLLDIRRAIDIKSQPLPIPVTSLESPLSAHPAGRTDVFAGQNTDGTYSGLRYRLGVHDILDPPSGFPPNSQLNVPSIELRFDHDKHRVFFERLEFFDLIHLPPSEKGYRSAAFHINANIHREQALFRGKEGTVFDFSFARGVRATSEPLGLVVYLLPGTNVSLSPKYDAFGQVGFGGESGVVASPHQRLRLHFNATAHYYWPLSRPILSVNGSMRLQLTKIFSLGSKVTWQEPGLPIQWQAGIGVFH
jgi:hypothetical protein